MKKIFVLVLILSAIIIFTGCSKDMGSEDAQSSGILSGITGIMSSLDQQYQAGWNKFEKNDIEGALKEFNTLLLNKPSATLLSATETAIGWINLKKGNATEALTLFEKNHNVLTDAKIGTALCYLSDRDSKNVGKAVNLLETAGFSSMDFNYVAPSGLKLTTAEIRAVMALYYAQLGDKVRAGYQIRKANSLEPQNVYDISEVLKNIYFVDVNPSTSGSGI